MKKLISVKSGVQVSLHAAASGDDQDSVLLCVDIQNPLSTGSAHLDAIELDVQGGYAHLIVPSDMPDKDLCRPPLTLKPGECVMWTYRLTFFDPLLDAKSAYKPAFQPPFPLSESSNILGISLKYHHTLNRSNPIQSQWFCELGSPGELVLVSTRQGLINSTITSNIAHSAPNTKASQKLAEGLAVTITGPVKVALYRVFTLSVVISNRTSETKRLMIQLPLNSAKFHPALMPRDTSSHNPIHMSPLEFLQLYDEQQSVHSSFLTLENNIKMAEVAPKSSVSVHIHFIPINGPGTLQRIRNIEVMDLDLKETVALEDAFEVLIMPPS